MYEHRVPAGPQRPAQERQVPEGAQDLGEARPGVGARRARVVVDPDLRHPHAARPQLDQHLGRQEGPVGVEPQPVEHLAPEQLHGAVDVAHAQPEGHRHDGVVGLGDEDPMERVAALDAVADHPIHRARGIGQPVEQALHLRQVELQVAVGEADELAAGFAKARFQGAAVAAVRLVMHAHARVGRGQRIGQLGRAVGRAVVHGQHLQRAVDQRGDLLQRQLHGALDVLLLVVGGEEEGEPGSGVVAARGGRGRRGRGGRQRGPWTCSRSV